MDAYSELGAQILGYSESKAWRTGIAGSFLDAESKFDILRIEKILELILRDHWNIYHEC